MKRLAFLALSVMIIIAMATEPAMAAAKARWKFINIIPAGQIYTQYFNQLAADITKATNGEVEVTSYPAGELPYKGTDHLKVLGKGLVEMAEVVAGFVFGEAPLLAMPDLPYVALNEEQMKTYRKFVLPYIWEELRKREVEPIAWVSYGPRQIVSRKPTNTLADMKGQKIRTAGGLQDVYIKLWGGIPTFVVWAEVYPAAQRGIVDGIMTATLAIKESKVYEVCPYFFKIEGPLMHQYICVNKKAWDTLSKKNQEAIRKVAVEWKEFWDRKVMYELDAAALKEMREKGQIKNVSELSWEERIKTRKELLPELKEYVKKHMQPKGPEAFEKALKELKLE
ncbi:MAG: TRAP transporter substrate-binding protein DctP [Deltaproteobacteria bacterium]|nr:TRAP transporter substrate-binding protein DctP [Deltaproteobacteria bacterium]